MKTELATTQQTTQQTQTTKYYKNAPLPFQGQKRFFVKAYVDALKEYPEDSIFVDLFGGSGLLSHVTKREKPQAQVVYNDFDYYTKRLENIPQTNALISEIRATGFDLIGRKERIPDEIRTKIIDIVRKHEAQGEFIDYITLSTQLCFPNNYVFSFAELEKMKPFYVRLSSTPYAADGYLDGLTITHKDYRALYNEYKDNPKAVFIFDPPYLSTDVTTYTKARAHYWKLTDYLDIIPLLQGKKFFYFTSHKSTIVELFECLEKQGMAQNPFAPCKQRSRVNCPNGDTKYTDIMLYKTE